MRDNTQYDRILVIRTDRIVDVVLSTPVLKSIRETYRKAFLAFMVSPYTNDLVKNNPDIDLIIVDDHREKHKGVLGFFRLLAHIRTLRFDTALCLYVNLRLSLLIFLAGIPRRVGPRSKLASLLLTRSVRQSRSKIEKHESVYNLELARHIGVTGHPKPVLLVSTYSRNRMQSHMERWGIRKDYPLIGIHPGSGGSSRNWPLACYARLIQDLQRYREMQICITCAPWESHLLRCADWGKSKNIFSYSGQNGLDEFAALLEHLDVFVSGSTGPMHMAAALGVPLVALFCPRFACSPIRWGPLTDKKIILMPVTEESCDLCREEKCDYYDCMETISTEMVREAVFSLLDKNKLARP